jgi:hypothetical protein
MEQYHSPRDFCEIPYKGFLIKFVVTIRLWFKWEKVTRYVKTFVYLKYLTVISVSSLGIVLCEVRAEADVG